MLCLIRIRIRFRSLLLSLVLLHSAATRADQGSSLPPPPAQSPADDDGDDDYPPIAQGSTTTPDTFGSSPPQFAGPVVLAPRRTYRKDPLNGFQTYTAGWNFTDHHYWASVGYSAAPFFAIAAAWFLTFALCLSVVCIRRCCRSSPDPEKPKFSDTTTMSYSSIAYPLSLVALVVFSVLAIIGCLILHTGHAKFYSTTVSTLDYVAEQADATSHNLTDVSGYLSAAKQINVDQVSLPPNAQADIDQTRTKIDSSATTLVNSANNTSKQITNWMQSVRLALISLTVVMILLICLGLVFSILGMKIPMYILVVTAWILVTGTLILCGVFLLLHNATGDTCVAMNQWVQMNPVPVADTQLHTALDDVLGCVDNATVQEALSKTKQVTSQLVDLVNTVISNVTNLNFSPSFPSMYFNQSGPPVPSLCNPFHSDLTDRACAPGEVDLNNATEAWSGYVCQTQTQNQTMLLPNGNINEICVTAGRITPRLYDQMAATVNVSYGLYQSGPIVSGLEDCSFVRQTFSYVDSAYCPGLRKYSQRIYIGLAMVAVAVMLSLVFWVIYGRERWRRLHKLSTKEEGDIAVEDKQHQHQHQHQS